MPLLDVLYLLFIVLSTILVKIFPDLKTLFKSVEKILSKLKKDKKN